MDVKGSSSSFQFSGVSEVATRTLRGELVATRLADLLPRAFGPGDVPPSGAP